MDVDEVWQAIDAQRLGLAAILDQLTEPEWRQPSLCEGWTVRDVAAHLALQQTGLLEAVAGAIRHPAGMNTMIRDVARRRAAAPTEELTAAIRAMVGSRKHNFGVTYRETLIDILVHGQDITVPLGRAHPMPADAAAAAASRVWAIGWPFRARRRFAGFRITATDTAWTVGEGPQVEGPMEAILLVLTGRHIALPRLSGDGIPTLHARLDAVAR